VILDADKSVLLVRYEVRRDRGPVAFWATPGGGLEVGESTRDAARRELAEETGLTASIGQELWQLSIEFESPSGPVVQDERFFLVELPDVAPHVRNSSAEAIREHRWWSVPDLLISNETVFPEDLGARLQALLSSAV
jgi:8-oxo-dGTP pyrophosphatase MutT (NUDIX family)